MNNPLVSIITGYYNRENFVDDSIQSLCDQTYQNIEIIIFDDCSTDNTFEKLKIFANKDARIHLIRNKKNRGFVNSLIDALDSAKGTYIAIHGSGDYSFPTRIEKQVEILQNNSKIGVVGCYFENISNEKKIEKIEFPLDARGVLLKYNTFSHGEVMFRKTVYQLAGGYRNLFIFSQDYDLWCRMSHFCQFYNVPEVLYRRYLLGDGASVRPEKRWLQTLLAILIRKNQRSLLFEQKDIIDNFTIDSLHEMSLCKSESIELYYEYISSLKKFGKTNKIKQSIAKLSKNNRLPLLKIANVLDILPTSLSQNLLKNRIFNKIVYELFIK